jgi:hypothetical protein
MTTDNQNTQVTDGFHLVIDALKANDLDTILVSLVFQLLTYAVWLKPKDCALLVSVTSSMLVTLQQLLAI